MEELIATPRREDDQLPGARPQVRSLPTSGKMSRPGGRIAPDYGAMALVTHILGYNGDES